MNLVRCWVMMMLLIEKQMARAAHVCLAMAHLQVSVCRERISRGLVSVQQVSLTEIVRILVARGKELTNE